MRIVNRSDRIRFWDCVPFDAPVCCWRWRGPVYRNGRAMFHPSGGGKTRAHVVMFDLVHRPHTDAEEVMQDCGQHDCVNPRHLSVVPKGVCSIDGCSRKVRSLRLCLHHYHRLRRHGDPNKGNVSSDKVNAAFQRACEHTGLECFVWPFRRSATGYPRGAVGIGEHAVHRAVCEAVHGPPSSPDMHAAHLCGNRSCVNPGHLEWSSQLENMFDLAVHRALRGEGKDPRHVVTDFCGKHNVDPIRFAQRSARITRIMHHQMKLQLEAAA